MPQNQKPHPHILHSSQMPSASTDSQRSAVPTVYYVIFAILEPLIILLSLLGGILDPGKVCTRQLAVHT